MTVLAPPPRVRRRSPVAYAGGALAVLGLSFGAGYAAGERAGELRSIEIQAQHRTPANLDEERGLQESLTFYRQLADGVPPAPPAADREPAPKVLGAMDRLRRGPPKEAPDPASALAAGPAESGQYTLQVSAYQTKIEAEAEQARLSGLGFSPYVVSATLPGRGVWHRVRIGAFASESAARRGRALLAEAAIPGWVLRTE